MILSTKISNCNNYSINFLRKKFIRNVAGYIVTTLFGIITCKLCLNRFWLLDYFITKRDGYFLGTHCLALELLWPGWLITAACATVSNLMLSITYLIVEFTFLLTDDVHRRREADIEVRSETDSSIATEAEVRATSPAHGFSRHVY